MHPGGVEETERRVARQRRKLVSVVTPVHNGGRFVAECIESVLAQTYTRFEYVVCENYSTDETPEVVMRYAHLDSRIRIVRPPRFLPLVANWNFAASRISGDSAYLKFVHADDLLAPTCLERMVEVADRHPTAVMVGALRRLGDDVVDLDGIPPTTEIVPGRWLLRRQLVGIPYTTGPPTSTLLRAVASARQGRLYDETYVHADDALSYRLLLDGDFGYVGEPLTYTRLHDASVTSSWCIRAGTWEVEHIRMALEFGSEVLTRDELERVVRRWERMYAVRLAKWTVSLKLARDREVREYHRTALERLEHAARSAGHVLSPPLKAYAMVLGSGGLEPVVAARDLG